MGDININSEELSDNQRDDHVDNEIKLCFSKDSPKSFFVFAGAGSGKTRSLINALSYLNKEVGEQFSIYSKKIAVINYTNVLCDKISQGYQFKLIFAYFKFIIFFWI